MNGYSVENPSTPQETIPVKLGESYKSRFGNENPAVYVMLKSFSRFFCCLNAYTAFSRRLPPKSNDRGSNRDKSILILFQWRFQPKREAKIRIQGRKLDQ